LVVDDKSEFREATFQTAMSALQTPNELEEKSGVAASGRKLKKRTGSIQVDLVKIIR
jgi:hypothetical protein